MDISLQIETTKNEINILVTLDSRYLGPLTEMLRSYIIFHKHVTTNLFIANSSLTNEDLAKIKSVVERERVNIFDIKVTDDYFKNTPVIERLSEESFYRLLAFLYLPSEVEKCLYLDPDIIIRKPLDGLYHTELGDSYIAAAGHMRGICEFANFTRLDLSDKQQRYFNSGVMLMNLSAIRRDFTLQTVLLCIENNIQRLILGDQDVANMIFGENMLLIDERIYNLDERCFKYYKKRGEIDINWVKDHTAIIHYNGKYKPWLDGYKGELNCFYPDVSEKGAAPKGMLKKQARSILRIIHPQKRHLVGILVAVIIIASALFSYFYFGEKMFDAISKPELLRNYLNRYGVFDDALFILIRSVQTVIKFIPAEPLEIASGYIWGTVRGGLYCLIGNVAGSVFIIYITGKFGDRLQKKISFSRHKALVDFFNNSDKLYIMLFILYLIPGSPKDGFTYFAAFLPVKTVPFLIITSIARIPSIISSTLCGSTMANGQYIISVVVFVATAAVALVGMLVYKRYIKNKNKTDMISKEDKNA